jgi:hypothetical protein
LLEAALAIPDNGPLALQSEINVIEYRNIRIKRAERAHEVKRDIPDDPATMALFECLGSALKQ